MYEDYTGKDLILATGAPGSRWSGSLRMLTANVNVNSTDESPDRYYDHVALNPKTGKMATRGWHRGAYWGPDHEFGKTFDKIDQMSKQDIIKEFKGPYTDWESGVKIIKSHWFAYHLPFLKEMFPDAKFFAKHMPNDDCFEWWHVCGGWDISYPHYFWYKDDERMKQQIAIENEHILNFFKEVKHYNIKDLFAKLGLPNETITWQDFCAKDAKLSEVLKYHQPSEDGNYDHALNFVVEKHKSAIL